MSDDVASAFDPGTTVAEGQRLLRALRELCEESDNVMLEEAGHPEPKDGWPPPSPLDSVGEDLAKELRAGLAGLALHRRRGNGRWPPTLECILDGAQMAARMELQRGEPGGLCALLPTYAYLVVLQVADDATAISVAERAAQLLDDDLAAGRTAA